MAVKAKGSGMVPLAMLEPVPDLKLAIVGLVDGRESEMAARLEVSGDKLSRMATLVRDACLKKGRCFFCAKELDATFKQAAKVGWKQLSPVLCSCLAEVRTGYREYIPNWAQQVEMIAARVEARELDPATPVYANQCRDSSTHPHCQGTFIVYAGDVARNVRKWKKHEKWTRCAACRNVHVTKAQKSTTEQQQPNAQQSKNINKKQKQHRQHQHQHHQRHGAPLKATVGELAEQHSPEGAHIGNEDTSARPVLDKKASES